MFQSFLFVGCKFVQNGSSIIIRTSSRNISEFSNYAVLGCSKVSKTFQNKSLHLYKSTTTNVIHSYSTDKSPANEETEKKRPTVSTRKNKEDSGPLITLFGTDNNPTVLALSDAEKLAKRRDLRLVSVVPLDTKTQRPVYKLMTLAQCYEEEKKEKSGKKGSASKGEKLLTLTSRITEHDLSTRLRHIKKWLLKAVEVRIIINGEANNIIGAEHVYKKIEESVKTEGRIVQKRIKGNDIRFQILPPKKTRDSTQISDTPET